MKSVFRTARIIRDFILGILSEEDQADFDQWLKQDEFHREQLQEWKKEDYITRKIQEYTPFDAQKGFARFQAARRKIDRPKRISWIVRVAASVLLLVSIGGYWFWRQTQEPEMQLTISSAILPAQQGAVLILDNGTRIALNDSLPEDKLVAAAHISWEGRHIRYQDTSVVSHPEYHTLLVPRGSEFSIILADGSRVWLNAGSEMRYPVPFELNRRKIFLSGEAYLEVAREADRPFVVRTEEMDISVLGTSFNVKAYPEEGTETTLVEGRVRVNAGNRVEEILPGEQAFFKEGTLAVRQVDVNAYTAWKTNRFVFTDKALKEIIRELERWYDVRFSVEEAEIQEIHFTGNLPRYEQLDKVLEMLALTTHIRFVRTERSVVVEKE